MAKARPPEKPILQKRKERDRPASDQNIFQKNERSPQVIEIK